MKFPSILRIITVTATLLCLLPVSALAQTSGTITGTVTDPTKGVMPGVNVEMNIELIAPIAMEKGLRFAIREGGRTVGAGTVSEVVE